KTGHRVPEEGDVECHLDLGFSGLAVDPAVEDQKLIEGRGLDIRGGQDRKIAERRGPPGWNDHPATEGLVRWNPGPPVGAVEVHRVALANRVRKTLRIGRGGALEVTRQDHRLNLDGRDCRDVDETGL